MKLGEVADALGLTIEGDGGLELTGLAGLEDAGASDLSFVTGPKYRKAFDASAAGAVLAPPGFDTSSRPCLRSVQPYADFGRAIALLLPRSAPEPGVHASAVIAPDARVPGDAVIGPYVVVGEGVEIGARARLDPHVVIYPGVRIGDDCHLHSGVHVLHDALIGDRVTIQSGSVIGSEGFGFTFDAQGRNVRIPHRSGVRIGDDCDIGANVAIDSSHPGHARRGQESSCTWIGDGVKMDNFVHVAHGCEVGDRSVLCAKVAIAGGVVIGSSVYMGGDTIVGNAARVGDGCMIGAGSGIISDLEPGSQVLGRPAIERRLWAKWAAARKKLPDLLRRVRKIEDHLKID